jgi:hypothetical protein
LEKIEKAHKSAMALAERVTEREAGIRLSPDNDCKSLFVKNLRG